MPQVLFVHSGTTSGESHRARQGAYTRKMARELKDAVRGRGVRFLDRDIAAKPPCLVDSTWIKAAQTPPPSRSKEQMHRLRESDLLVNEVLHSDVIVIACPVYNFGVPTPLKAWVDNIVRPGKTYTTNEQRPNPVVYGLLHNKRVVLLVSSAHASPAANGMTTAIDHADTAVKSVFKQLGVHNFDVVVLEGAGEDDKEQLKSSWSQCEQQIAQVGASVHAHLFSTR